MFLNCFEFLYNYHLIHLFMYILIKTPFCFKFICICRFIYITRHFKIWQDYLVIQPSWPTEKYFKALFYYEFKACIYNSRLARLHCQVGGNLFKLGIGKKLTRDSPDNLKAVLFESFRESGFFKSKIYKGLLPVWQKFSWSG